MTDINDFTDYTESCGCGHERRKHTAVGCNGTRRQLDATALPKPRYAPEDAESPFAWPVNWPRPRNAPHIEEPCGCPGFSFADPEPPEDW